MGMNHIENDFDTNYFSAREESSSKRKVMHQLDFQWTREKLRQQNLTSNLKILDIGCSDGTFTTLFRNLGTLHGVEINVEQRKIAQLSLDECFEEIPNEGNYDVVILRGVLHHLPDLSKLSNCLKNCLRDGGVLVVLSNPNPDSYVYKRLSTLPALEVGDGFKSNYKLWSPTEFVSKFSDLGMSNFNFDFPYLETPYANLFCDLTMFVKSLFAKGMPFPFFRNMFNVIAIKAGSKN